MEERSKSFFCYCHYLIEGVVNYILRMFHVKYSELLAVGLFKSILLYKNHQNWLTMEKGSKSKVACGTKPRDLFGIFCLLLN